MSSNVEPAVSLLISEFRKIPAESKKSMFLLELKNMAAKGQGSDECIAQTLWKKLYLLSIGAKISTLDFVKGCGFPNLPIKRIGYQGIAMSKSSKTLFLLQNTVQKDIENELFCPDALIFISNVLDTNEIFKYIANKLILPSENSKHFAKYLVSISKYDSNRFFEMRSEKEINLYVKLQIISDQELEHKLTPPGIEYLVHSLNKTNCPYTRLKIMQILHNLVKAQKYTLNENTVTNLKTYVFGPNTRSKKQIEIGTCIQAIRLLLISSNDYDRINELVLSLINSKSLNSRYLGLKLAVEFKINQEITISKLIELGIKREMCFNFLFQLIDSKSYKFVYQNLEFLKECDQLTPEAVNKTEKDVLKLIKRSCDFGDQEFICKALYEHPKLYFNIRNGKLLSRDQCKGFFKMLLEESDMNYYLMIYDLFPVKNTSEKLVSEIAKKHLENLIQLDDPNVFLVIENLFTFLCLQGSPTINRKVCLEVLNHEYLKIKDHRTFNKVIDGIGLFNLVLDSKMIHVENNEFVEYFVDSDLEINYPQNLVRNNKISVTGANKRCSTIENNIVKEIYEFTDSCYLSVVSSKGIIKKTIFKN